MQAPDIPLFPLVRRSPGMFVLALACVVVLVLFSEMVYRNSARNVDALAAASQAQSEIQNLRQRVQVAVAAQQSYLLTQRQEYLGPYLRAENDVADSLAVLQQRYAQRPEATELLIELRALCERLLEQLAQELRRQQTDGGPRALTDDHDLQMAAIGRLSDQLLALETQVAAERQKDIDRTLLLSRIGMACLCAVILYALIKYLRQSHALAQHQLEMARMVQGERDRLEAVVLQRTTQLVQLTQHLQTAREDERHRLARNLHDDLGALLTSAKLDTARLRSRLSAQGAGAETQELLAHLVGTLNEGIALGRRIIEDLRPSALSNLGLLPSLEILLREFADHASLQAHTALAPVQLSEAAELMAYRLVQEATTNIAKHAKARNVWLQVGQHEGTVEVSVRDDGAGFDTDAKTRSAYGLLGMRYRVESVGGRLQVTSTPGKGTLIQVRLPAQPNVAPTEPA